MKIRVKRELNATVQYMLKLIFYKKNAKSRIFIILPQILHDLLSGKPAESWGQNRANFMEE